MNVETRTTTVYGLRVNALDHAFGIDTAYPEFSWKLSDGPQWPQSAYAIQVSLDEGFKRVIWDTERVTGDMQFGVLYDGKPLRSCRRYFWRVRAWDAEGAPSSWSEKGWFETAFLESKQLEASWIGVNSSVGFGDRAALYLQRKVVVSSPVVKGRAYVSALGWYRFFVNQHDLTGNALVPRWTPLDDLVEYQTYDVTDCFACGTNVIAMAIGDGRFRGKLGASSRRACYGDRLAGFARIELELADGSQQVICSDEKWHAGGGRILQSDPQDGEIVDLRIDDQQWLSGQTDTFGTQAQILSSTRKLVAEEVGRVEEVGRLRPAQVFRTRSGKQIVDFGQNFAGIVRVLLPSAHGTVIKLTYSELLNQAGEIDTEYLKLPIFPAVLQRDQVTLSEQSTWYQSWFTIHGFRYLEIDGLAREILPEEIEGIVISSRLEVGGTFECSDSRLNRLHQNVKWSLRSNFVDTPTDCPTRERSGWTGDIQVFANTAAKLVDVQAYLRRYLNNLKIEQLPDGRIPPFIPAETSKFSGGMPRLEFIHSCSAGWGDVSVLLPWSLYCSYGDRNLLAGQYSSMQRWVEFLRRLAHSGRGRGRWFSKKLGKHENFLVDGGFHWGEWLRPGDGIPQILKAWAIPEVAVSTGYLANSSRLLSKIATLLGKDEDAEKYHSLWQSTRAAWRAAFIRSDGCIGKNRQDDYVRALAFELLEPDEISGAVTRLVERIVAREYHLETGFLSTPLLLPILAQHGHADIAYKLLLQTSNPSWLAQIDRGATTVWETWEGYDPTGKAKMSHNHYAFGAVVSWLYEGIAGLSAVEPGYRRIRIAPCIGGGLTSAAASVKTPFGLARSAWRIERGEVHLEVMVPPGSEAFVCLGDGRIEQVGSGDHQFVWSHSS